MLGDLLPAAVAVAATATAATPSIELSNGCGASDAWQELHSASCQSAQLSGTLGRTVEKLLLHAGCGDGPQAAALAPLRQQVKRQLAEKASLEQRLEAAARALRGQRAALAVAPAGGAGPGGPGSNGAAVDEARALRATNQKLEMKLDLYKQQLAARGRSPSEAAAPPPPAPPAPAAAAAAEAEAARLRELREALALVRDELAAASAAAAVAAESATSKQRQLSQELNELKKQQAPSQDPPQAPLPSSQAQDAAAAAAVAAAAALASLQQEADAARTRAKEAEARLRVQEAAHQAERSQVRGANEQQQPPPTPVDAATTVAPLTPQSAAPAADVTGAGTAVSGGGDVGVGGGVGGGDGGGDGGAGGGGGGSVGSSGGSSGGSPIRATRPGEVTTLRQLGTLDRLEALTDRLLRTLFGGIFGQSPIFGLLGAEVRGGDEEGDLESGGAACVEPARDTATAAHLPAGGRAGDSSAAARDLETGAATVPSVPPATAPLPLPPAAAVVQSAATAAATGPLLAPTAAMTDAAVLPVAEFTPPAAAIAMASDEDEVAPPPLLSADVTHTGDGATHTRAIAAEAAPEAQKKPLLDV